MTDQEAARAYLEKALAEASIRPIEASRRLGMNPTYFQQYIRYGKPQWLSEGIRRGLLQLIPLDEEKLKPPPKKLRPAKKSLGNGDNKSEVDAPGYSKLMNEPGALEVLRIWSVIGPETRELALKILRTMAENTRAVVA